MSKEVFKEVFKNNVWCSKESLSGGGSELGTTQYIREQLPVFIKQWKIKTILDIPCGDYNWMKECKLGAECYYGADIVDEIVSLCIERYEDEKHRFLVLDILNDKLPSVDLIFVKDLFLHLSCEDIWKALRNIKRSGSKYVMISNDYGLLNENLEMETGGHYRGIDLSLYPFNLKQPLFEIEAKPYRTKLSLWETKDIF